MYVFVNVIEPKCGFLHLAASFIFFVGKLIIHIPSAPGHPSLFVFYFKLYGFCNSVRQRQTAPFFGAGALLFNAVLNSDK